MPPRPSGVTKNTDWSVGPRENWSISRAALYQGLYGDERLHCLIAHLAQ
jgi:hypothetical protein